MEFLKAVTTDHEDVMINMANIVRMIMVEEGTCRIWTNDGDDVFIKAESLDELFKGDDDQEARKDYLLGICQDYIGENDLESGTVEYDGEIKDGSDLVLDISFAMGTVEYDGLPEVDNDTE